MAQIFVSYMRRDKSIAETYVEQLRAVYDHDDVWYDASLHGGEDWWRHILRQIDACEVFIFLISNRSLQSYYCQQELQYAVEQGKQILPVMIHGRVNLDNAPPPIRRVIKRLQYVETYRLWRPWQVTQLLAAVRRLLNKAAGQPTANGDTENYTVGGNVDATYANFGGTINIHNPPPTSDSPNYIPLAVALIGAAALTVVLTIGVLTLAFATSSGLPPEPTLAGVRATPTSSATDPAEDTKTPALIPVPVLTPDLDFRIEQLSGQTNTSTPALIVVPNSDFRVEQLFGWTNTSTPSDLTAAAAAGTRIAQAAANTLTAPPTPTRTPTNMLTSSRTATATATPLPTDTLTLLPKDTPIPSNTPTSTSPPALTAVSDTPSNGGGPGTPQQSSVGNADIYSFYDDNLDYPDVMLVKLQLIMSELAVTPTPFGPEMLVPANPNLERPQVRANPETLTPRPARDEENVEAIPAYIIAELECSETIFSGCNQKSVRNIRLSGINEWVWRVQPMSEMSSRQSLSLVLYSANRDGEKVSNTPIWRHDFSVNVTVPFNMLYFIQENSNSLISGLVAVLVALISGGYIINRNKGENKTDQLNKQKQTKVFISYKRDVSAGYGRTIHDKLTEKGVDVFIDVDDIHAGSFSESIRENIREAEYFIVILAPNTLTSRWVVKEVEYAYKYEKTIIPVLINDFDLYGDDVPERLQFLQEQNAVTLRPDYVDAAIERINRFLKPN